MEFVATDSTRKRLAWLFRQFDVHAIPAAPRAFRNGDNSIAVPYDGDLRIVNRDFFLVHRPTPLRACLRIRR
jgi:hypothetical protein